jgi:hypothetical protein
VVVRHAEPVLAVHPRGLVVDVVAERPQQRGERAVEFVTEAAPPPLDDLRDQGGVVEHDVLADVDAEVLERDGVEVPAL